MISGNGDDGIDVSGGATNTLIEGDYAGVDQTGTKALLNTNGIVVISAAGVTIGGTTQGAEMVISGNAKSGVVISSAAATSVVILGDFIGTDSSGTSAIANNLNGIYLSHAAGVTVGGTAAGDRNIISGNTGVGIGLSGPTTGSVIEGNFIGADATGAGALGNGTGVQLDSGASNNTIGGAAAIDGNTIAFNSNAGVYVDTSAGTGNEIRLNSIFSNGGLGIDLGVAGVTPNDSQGHAGANNYQNFPANISALSSAGTTTVSGTLDSTPSTSFALDFYTISSSNASGYGEGRYILGSGSVNTDASGHASFSFPFATPASGAQFVTATATDSAGNTSEFSQATGNNHPPTAVIGFTSITMNVGAPVAFNGGGSSDPDGNVLTYSWSFGDGATASGVAPSHTYTAPGVDHVTLTVSDGFGGVDVAQATVTVNDAPPVFSHGSFFAPEVFGSPTPGDGFGEAIAALNGNIAVAAGSTTARRPRCTPAPFTSTMVFPPMTAFRPPTPTVRSCTSSPTPIRPLAMNLARRSPWRATS